LGAEFVPHTSMTDMFASEPHAPAGASPETARQGDEVTGTLADLERKLGELQRELASIGRRETPAPAPTPAPATTPAPAPTPPPQATPPPLRSEPLPRPTPAPALEPPTSPATAFSPPRGRLVDEAVEQPAEPFERVRPSDAQLASLAELRRFRDRLERFARELAVEYDALLGRVMTGLSSAPARAASATAGSPRASSASPAAPLEAAAASHAPAPPASTPAPPAPEVAAAQSPENALFEGRVELGVGPFYDIGSLGAFEQRLASLPGVSEASVRRFEASHAVVDVRLAAPVALVRELRRAAGSDFSVREVASGRILLTFDES
jgi:hypothetical protein